MRHRLAVLVLAGAALCSATAVAVPFGVQLGSDRLMLDAPPGFFDSAGFGSPRLTEFAENIAEPGSRVLVLALSEADSRRFSAGDSLELRRYLLAVAPRAQERERISTAQFASLLQESARTMAAPAQEPPDYRLWLEGRPPGQPHVIAELRRDAQVFSVLMGTMVPQVAKNFWTPTPPPLFKLSTMTLTHLKGRAVYISAYSAYESPADVFWIRDITSRWVAELQRLNK